MLALRLVPRSLRFALLAPCLLAAAPALAQGRLEARYVVTLAGIQIGKGNWVVDINGSHFSAAASGITTGLMRVLTKGEDNKVRLPVTAVQRHGVLDPMTASLIHVPGAGSPLVPDACQRTLPIFDGRIRYDLNLAFKRMDEVKADKGYAGPVVVCAVYFSPIGGYIPSRVTIRYLKKQRDMEIWLAPIAGTRVLVPFRAQGPTPIGEAVMEATEFVASANPTTGASAKGRKRR
ncbi:MAG: DUF3108 domain-containing protein [Pseudolabrys sp.]